MPIYEYRHESVCGPQCKEVFETFQKINDDKFTVCPDCGQPVLRLISRSRVKVIQEGVYQEVDGEPINLPGNRAAAKAKIRDHIRETKGDEAAERSEILSPDDYGR